MRKIYLFRFEGEAIGIHHFKTDASFGSKDIRFQFEIVVAFFDADFLQKGPEKRAIIEAALCEQYAEKRINQVKIIQTDKIHLIESGYTSS